ncbi:3-hydroxyacyl-CoA dehydrogenase family protein [Shouchella hunanensis]|uniref:3-hydroxyacyl-CoA dehydrogenase family protein n=1 Tax=Shouchella hunanensis TaxID=766894 RepID=A0ABY7VZD5_9BACI|nr:3-hydroxyacyl-CoA dehydrogenase family protein [Shouchella hunanensis]WDF02027.1 3-hydroxyacyl-CoA dehydrogenase family protein [Shouchella hunanensis]
MSLVGVIGAGVMGVDLAISLAQHGHKVLLKDNDPVKLKSVEVRIRKNIRSYKMLSKEYYSVVPDSILEKITVTDNYNNFGECSFIIENTYEEIKNKITVLEELKEYCNDDSIIGINTSCISITKLAKYFNKPDHIIGTHFMNPVPLKETVETVKGYHTSQETIEKTTLFLQSIKKKPIVVEDSPGFVANRLSHLFMNEAAYLVQEKIADPYQIDLMFKKGYEHKLGPLETIDLIGLDTVVDSLNVLYSSLQDTKFRCCPLLVKMVNAGLLGRKVGQGFYKYSL